MRAAASLTSAPHATSNAAAIGQVLAGVSCLAGADVFAKDMAEDIAPAQVTWLRYAVFAAAVLVLALARGAGGLKSRRPWLQAARAVAVLASAQFFVLGLAELGVAETTAIAFVAPVIVTALSIPLLGEVVGRRRWAALGIALCGVLIVIRPGLGAFQTAALLPLASALFGALGVVTARKLGAADTPLTTLAWTSGFGFLLLSLAAPLWFVPLDAPALLAGLGMGCLYTLGQAFLIQAYSHAPASLLAPFTYAQLLAAAVLGAIVFGQWPDGWSSLGMVVIAASGAYTILRERNLLSLKGVR